MKRCVVNYDFTGGRETKEITTDCPLVFVNEDTNVLTCRAFPFAIKVWRMRNKEAVNVLITKKGSILEEVVFFADWNSIRVGEKYCVGWNHTKRVITFAWIGSKGQTFNVEIPGLIRSVPPPLCCET